jgi:hypothetical protein
MTDITIADLTNKTVDDLGTGVFDVLAEAVKLHLQEQFDAGRITGPEYATVYLGALQATLQQSLTFLLSEQEASAKVELLQKQTDTQNAQTAQIFEEIAASKAKTSRENVLINKQSIKVQKEILDQEFITANLRPEEVFKIQEEIDLLQSRDLEQIADTTRKSNESTQKVLLMAAQTLGFASDTKIKLLKQMQDGFAVVLSIAGLGNVPEANQDAAIDALSNELLDDIGSLVDITASEPTVPPLS